MGRKAGSKNRNYPSMLLDQATEVATTIQDQASGMQVSKLTLAQLMDRSPSSSEFRELLLASRAYGLTSGGVNADQFDLTPLGDQATGGDEIAAQKARQKAVFNIEPFRTFLTAYNTKKVPSAAALTEFLVTTAGVAPGEGRRVRSSTYLLTPALRAFFACSRVLNGSTSPGRMAVRTRAWWRKVGPMKMKTVRRWTMSLPWISPLSQPYQRFRWAHRKRKRSSLPMERTGHRLIS